MRSFSSEYLEYIVSLQGWGWVCITAVILTTKKARNQPYGDPEGFED